MGERQKLFMWADPYPINYGNSMLVVVAPDLETAKLLAIGAPRYSYGQFERGHMPEGIKLGEPTRIVNIPCAEWHEWSE